MLQITGHRQVNYIGFMDIRTATEADFDALMALINTAFEVERFFKAEDRVSRPMLLVVLKAHCSSAPMR